MRLDSQIRDDLQFHKILKCYSFEDLWVIRDKQFTADTDTFSPTLVSPSYSCYLAALPQTLLQRQSFHSLAVTFPVSFGGQYCWLCCCCCCCWWLLLLIVSIVFPAADIVFCSVQLGFWLIFLCFVVVFRIIAISVACSFASDKR